MGNVKIKKNILFQLDMCWQLYNYHTENIEEPEALWSFDPKGLQVRRQEDRWSIDWPETENYEIGPSSIAWMMWHIIYWWSTAIDYNFGDGTLKKENVHWPGSIEKAKETINLLHDKWVSKLDDFSDADFQLKQYAKWPLVDRSFADIALWLNAELMKNATEIGFGRFLYASSMKNRLISESDVTHNVIKLDNIKM